MTRIAAFDCDGTLIRGDATRHVLLACRGPLGLALDLLRLTPVLLAWRLGRRSTDAVKQALLDQVFMATPLAKRQRVLERLAQDLVGQLRPEAVERLRWHQRQGDRCLIVSASPEPLLAPLAQQLGVELLATGCIDPLRVTPEHPFRLTTPNCKGPEKLRRLEEHLGYLPGQQQLEAYGDSRGDRELLQASARPHWRSFTVTPVAYRETGLGGALITAAAVALLVMAVVGVTRLEPTVRDQLAQACRSLVVWLPALYGLLALSYLGRYWRWRLLLGACSVGCWSWADAAGWFRGFALTATPAKLGELTRVQQLHHGLGYPRLPLLHAFAAERLCDVGAVILWLAALLPRALPFDQVVRWLVPSVLMSALILALFWRALRRRALQWRQHMPKGAMLRACAPALLVSLAFWGCEGLLLWLLVQALAPTHISATTAIGITLLSGTAGMASSLPAGVGVNEASTMLLLIQEGVPAGLALPIAVVRRLITPWSVVALAAALAVLPMTALDRHRQDC